MEFVTPGATNLGLFISAALVLLLVPGPAVLYIVARSIEQGRMAGFVSDLGIHSATLVHVAAAALGLSAILASSALAFSLVKYAGAAYLIWLGLRKIFGPVEEPDLSALARHGYGRLFRDGFIVNLFNPKTALFFLALFPQWIDPGAGPAWSQMLWFGAAFVALGLVSNSLYGLLGAGTLRSVLLRSPRAQRMSQVASGGVLVVLGLLAALAPSPASPAPSQ